MGLNINIPKDPPVEEIVSELVDEGQQVQTYKGNPAYAQAKLHWFTMNMRDEAAEQYTLKQLAEDQNLSYGYLRQIAASEEWNKELDEMRVKKTQLMMNRVLEMQVLSELDIRLRQAHIGRVAQSIALKGLQSMDPTKMKPSDLIMLLNIGLEQERKSLGMSNTPAETPEVREQKDQKANKKSVMDEAMQLMEKIKAKAQPEIKDVN